MSKKSSQIYKAAVDVFSKYGYEKARMDLIAERANVAKGTLYYHFKSKEDIFTNLIEDEIYNIKNLICNEVEKQINGKEKLEKSIILIVEYFFKYQDFAKIVLTEVWGTEKRQIKFRGLLKEVFEMIEEYIEQGVEEAIYKRNDVTLTSSSIFGMISITCLHAFFSNLDYTQEQLSEHVILFVNKGLLN